MLDHLILKLSLADGVGPVAINRIVSRAGTHFAWSDIQAFCITDWQTQGFSQRVAELLVRGLRDDSRLAHELALIEQRGIDWYTLLSPDYPKLLHGITVPPPVLYWRGTLRQTNDALAIVGSRAADGYGRRAIERMVPEFVAAGMTIVSGGARGADSMAHEATLRAGGTTWVVLGSGLQHLYPRENTKLFERIVDRGGALISAFAIEQQPAPGNFPVRNRIIAGLSRGCLVVQAAAKSGALITAHHALEQGRDVCAVPGQIDSRLSVGCHGLLQEGAKLVTCAGDLLAECGLSYCPARAAGIAAVTGAVMADSDSHQPDPEPTTPEGRIAHLCRSPRSTQDLLAELDIPLGELQRLLFELQLAGSIRQDLGGCWEAN